MPRKAAVIGAGLGGLSAAIDLRSRGFDVDLYEVSESTGGKAGIRRGRGYTFDTGPSLFTMPMVFEKVLKKAGVELEEAIQLVPLDIICKYFFSDGTVLNAYSDKEKLLAEFGSKTFDTKEDLTKFLGYCEKMYESAKDFFLFNSLEMVTDTFAEDPLKIFRTIARLDIFRTLHGSHKKWFKDPNTIQLFDRYATYSGSDPFKLPATLNIIPHVEYALGAYVPEKGIRAIPEALTKAAESSGVNIFTGKKVDKILSEDKKITGIETGGEEIPYDIVVSNADVNTTYKDLLGDKESKMSKRYSKLEPSSSAIVFYWGVKGEFKDLEVNNIFYSSDYKKEFDEIFNEHIPPEEPTVYVNISSKYCAEDAPGGCESWFVLVNVPYDSGQDWEEETKKVRERTLKVLEKRLGAEISSKIEFEEVMTPADIYRKTFSNKGSIYGISSNSKFAAFYRQPNRSEEYKGLYFAGGSAHPGGGMPLVVLSGMIAAELVEKHEGGPGE